MAMIILSLIILNLNLNLPIVYADDKDHERVKNQLIIADISDHIVKFDNYNDTLKQKLIQIQISQASSLDNAAKAIKQINSTQGLHNGIIQGAMVDESGNEDANATLVNAFNNLAGKKIGVAYFSDNWFHGIHFPLDKCISIRTTGAVPFIRIQNWIRQGDKLSDAGPYTHKNIIAGIFDTELRTYAQAAKLWHEIVDRVHFHGAKRGQALTRRHTGIL